MQEMFLLAQATTDLNGRSPILVQGLILLAVVTLVWLLIAWGLLVRGGYSKKSALAPRHRWRQVPWNLGEAILLLLLFFLLPGPLFFLLSRVPAEYCPAFLHVADSPAVTAGDCQSEQEGQSVVLPAETVSEDGAVSEDDAVSEYEAVSGKGEAVSELGETASEPPRPHPLTQLMQAENTPLPRVWILLLCFVTAVVVAPIGEEFLFRVLLQGAIARCFGREKTALAAVVSIGLPALLFALIHFRQADDAPDPDRLVVLFIITIVTTLLVLLLAVTGLRWRTRPLDFGIGRLRDLPFEFLRGTTILLLILPVLLATKILSDALFPGVVTDPIPIFILALVLGYLFWKTHRFATIVGVHAALNLIGFLGTMTLSG